MNDSFEADARTVGEAGEAATLGVIFAALREHTQQKSADVLVGPGDDAAVVRADGAVAVSSDAMVEGVDFRLDWTTGFQLGWKLAATNLSDIASMGARPVGLTVTVCAPQQTRVALLADITRGLSAAATALAPGCELIGGDLSHGAQLTFAVTALGSMSGAPVLRSGARIGDVVAYAGDLGLSGAGLRLLSTHCRAGCAAEQLASLWQTHTNEITAHLQPSPPIHLGVVAASAGATAMMDVSDGLALDASRLGLASGVTLNLSAELLSPFTTRVTRDDVLFGGEDHGLLATFPSAVALPDGFVRIGQVEDRTTDLLLDGVALEPRGWDPFSEHPASHIRGEF